MRRLQSALLLLALAFAFCPRLALADGWKVGDRVVTSRAATMRVTTGTVGTVPAETVLTVKAVNGDWLWVTHESNGWVKASEVVGLESRIEQINEEGDKLRDAGKFAEARKSYGRALAFDPKNFHALMWHADMFYGEEQYPLAVEGYNKALEVSPDNADLYWWRGDAHLLMSEAAAAVEDYNQSLRLSPTLWEVYGARAKAHANLGNISQAIVDDTVTSRFAKDVAERARAYSHRAGLYLGRGDFRAAAADFASAANLQPDNAVYWAKAALVLASSPDDDSRDGERAVQYALRACDASGHSSALALGALAASYSERGEFSAAAAIQSKAIDAADDDTKKEHQARLALYTAAKPFRDPDAAK